MSVCEECGIEFEPPHHHHKQRFCSYACSGRATARKRGQEPRGLQTCGHCGATFEAFAGDQRVYCSDACSRDATRKDRPKCEVCGKPVRLMRNRYCSKSCSNLARPRPGITSWIGFYTRAQKANPTPEPCATCGEPGKHRHHPDYSKPEAVVWLCHKCHQNLHHTGQKRYVRRVRPDKPPIIK